MARYHGGHEPVSLESSGCSSPAGERAAAGFRKRGVKKRLHKRSEPRVRRPGNPGPAAWTQVAAANVPDMTDGPGVVVSP